MLSTINIYLRFALIAGGFLLFAVLWAAFGFWYGFPFVLVAIVLLIGYLLLGTLQSSAMMLQTGDLDGAEKRLGLTFFPNLLFPANKSVYFMVKSTLATHRQDWEGAESWVRKALAAGLPTDNEKAVAHFQLAQLAARKSNWQMAQKHLDNLKALPNVTEPQIKAQVKELEKALAQRHMMKPGMAQMGGMYRPGGKRPRPKAR